MCSLASANVRRAQVNAQKSTPIGSHSTVSSVIPSVATAQQSTAVTASQHVVSTALGAEVVTKDENTMTNLPTLYVDNNVPPLPQRPAPSLSARRERVSTSPGGVMPLLTDTAARSPVCEAVTPVSRLEFLNDTVRVIGVLYFFACASESVGL
jgi:hypothetical protein